MDIPSERARRKNRSGTNIHHLSLAPLTSKLPLDADASQAPAYLTPDHASAATTTRPLATSYLQGRSAPTTPRLLSHSPAGARHHRRNPSAPGAHVNLTKSRSSASLAPGGAQPQHGRKGGLSGTMTPGRRYAGGMLPYRGHEHEYYSYDGDDHDHDDGNRALSEQDRQDSDWLLRTAAMVSAEARESKGQAWLVSRQSSTSLAGVRDAEGEAFEEELRRERAQRSRRGSVPSVQSLGREAYATPMGSRLASRSVSRAGRRSRLVTPGEREEGDGSSYFGGEQHSPAAQGGAGPDFINLDERLEALEREDTTRADEADVRRLLRRSGKQGGGGWLWGLLAVDEGGELEGSEDEGTQSVVSSSTAPGEQQGGRGERRFEGHREPYREEGIAPPKADEGGWQDAAWLLSVASKVMF